MRERLDTIGSVDDVVTVDIDRIFDDDSGGMYNELKIDKKKVEDELQQWEKIFTVSKSMLRRGDNILYDIQRWVAKRNIKKREGALKALKIASNIKKQERQSDNLQKLGKKFNLERWKAKNKSKRIGRKLKKRQGVRLS